MDLTSGKLGSLLFFLGLHGICSGSLHVLRQIESEDRTMMSLLTENCTNYKLQFDRVFSVPGDIAMLNSTLVAPDVFNYTSVPYNITWYDKKGEELSDQPGRVLLRGETLWFLNVTLDDDGEYTMVLRTPSRCYMQSTMLKVDQPVAGKCWRPQQTYQELTYGVIDHVSCPLKDYITKLDSYNIPFSIMWYKGCDLVIDGSDRFHYWDKTRLKFNKVNLEDHGSYTCTLTFSLGGVAGSVSETINASVKEDYCLCPQVHRPANETIKPPIGSSFNMTCEVFVPSRGNKICTVDLYWSNKNGFIDTNPSNNVYALNQTCERDDKKKGIVFKRVLVISKVREENYINYTCRAYSDRGHPWGNVILTPPDPCFMIPIASTLGSVMFVLISSVIIYYIFKIELALLFRKTFPIFYTNKDLDGKLYDAYVAYPQPCGAGFTEEVETFALQMLPEVLEKDCNYKLFIAGRDCLPGQAVVNSVFDNIQASRRFLLLYNASTFTSKSQTSSVSSHNNNNISKNSDGINNNESKTSDLNDSECFDGNDGDYRDTRQELECVAAMHKALMEGSLKVVLVELEEITPAQLALFPDSVRHLREKQGAVCWWKNQKTNQRWKSCTKRVDEEKGGQDSALSPSLSRSSKFWKEMEYHMPVKGKRVNPKKKALLNI